MNLYEKVNGYKTYILAATSVILTLIAYARGSVGGDTATLLTILASMVAALRDGIKKLE